MNAIVTLDKAGRIVLPKSIREALQVGPGDTLQIDAEEDRLVVSPVRVRPGLQKEHGVWVYRSGTPANTSLPDFVDEQRSHRNRQLLGNKP